MNLLVKVLYDREVLNMTVLLDHDVVYGMKMAKFIKRLFNNIERGIEL